MLRWVLCLLLCIAFCGCGCRSVPEGHLSRQIVVRVTRSGDIAVGDDVAPPEKVRKLLGAHGGDPAKTEILLSIAEARDPEEFAPAYAALRAAGYTKIVFVRPKKASSSVSPKPPSRR